MTPFYLKKKMSPQHSELNPKPKEKFAFLLFRLFLSEILSRVDSREQRQQAILLKNVEYSGQNCVFPVIFRRRRIWHDFYFVTQFSNLDFRANIKGSLPSNSTTPDRLQ